MIEQNIQQQKSFSVLLIGDSCLDVYMVGSVDRLSPEAPVPVIKLVQNYSAPGMASNVHTNLQALGVDADFITNGETVTKTRYIDKRSGQHLLRVDDEPKIVPWSSRTPFPMEEYDAVIISDYNKGFLSYEHIENIIRTVKCPVFIDTKKQDLSRFSAPHVYVKINELEYKNRFSIPQNLIVTIGDRGATIYRLGCEEVTYSTTQVEVVDVCGCGDTFLAAFAYKYLFTHKINDAIIYANVAAGVTVQHRGNYAPTLEEIENARY